MSKVQHPKCKKQKEKEKKLKWNTKPRINQKPVRTNTDNTEWLFLQMKHRDTQTKDWKKVCDLWGYNLSNTKVLLVCLILPLPYIGITAVALMYWSMQILNPGTALVLDWQLSVVLMSGEEKLDCHSHSLDIRSTDCLCFCQIWNVFCDWNRQDLFS